MAERPIPAIFALIRVEIAGIHVGSSQIVNLVLFL